MAAKRTRRMPEEEHENHERWLVTYADMITLLMVLFIVMFAISQVDQKKFNELKDGLAAGFGSSSSVLQDSDSVLDANGAEPITPQFGAEQKGTKSAGTSNQQADASKTQTDEAAAEQAAAAEASQLLATRDEIERKLKKRGLVGDVRFALDGRGLVLSLVSRHIVFAPDLATLTPRGEQILAALGPVLADLDQDLEIAGHTNQEKVKPRYYPSDWDLSAARAITVLRYLTRASGIPLYRLHATAYGHTRPLVPPSQPDSQRLNRRVDVIVLRQHVDLTQQDLTDLSELPGGTDSTQSDASGSPTGADDSTSTNASRTTTTQGGDS